MKSIAKKACILIHAKICFFATNGLASAQSIRIDGTTPTQLTNCSGDCLIGGGLQQGDNLFHSFERLNVDSRATVLFQDPGVSNILSRVTGNGLSEILGTLGVSGGDANLFLINPNGIIFGSDSSLDLNGSFLATTADAIRFSEQGLLDAASGEIPLLTINPSALSFRVKNPGAIVNRSNPPAGENPDNLETFGLRVPNGKSLLLVGGDVDIAGGNLTALEGRIEIGGLASAGEIEVNFSDPAGSRIDLNFPEQIERADVSLSDTAFVSVFSADSGGDAVINAQNITIAEGSGVIAGIDGEATTVNSQGGDIVLDATEEIEIDGGVVANQVSSPETKGNAGDININSGSLFISDDSFIDNSTRGKGDAGNINIFVKNSLAISSDSAVLSIVEAGAAGDAGKIDLAAENISISDGSQLGTSVFGQGNGGNIFVDAKESVNIVGFDLAESRSSGILTATEAEGTGRAGNITINTDSFRIAEGGLISSQTLNEGNGGNISINANSFSATDGGQIATSTASSGNAGDINIQVVENLLLSGNEPNFVERIANFEGNVISEPPGNSGFFANVRPEASGAGGNINVAAGQLEIFDNAEINVGAEGTGEAGSLTIDSQDVTLDLGSLTAETRVGDRGNISLNNANALVLRNNSQITTNAFESATGGDITIDADGIIALDNSDITANAVRGQGGEIQITTQGIFSEPNSQITAASELGIDGTVTFNTPDVDPTSGIFELPNVPLDAENVLAQDLCRLEGDRIAKGSSFVITGKGGLVPTSAGSLDNRDRLVDWASREDVEMSDSGAVGIRQRAKREQAEQDYPQVRQAKGLLVGKDGGTWLTANAPGATVSSSSMVHPDCGS